MKLLVFEYITGGGMTTTPNVSLVREGDKMLFALLKDLTEIPSLSLMALRDSRLAFSTNAAAAVDWITVEPHDEMMSSLGCAIDQVDAVWPIAPETGRVLESVCALVRRRGKILLNSTAEGVRSAASKFLTATRLGDKGIPVVPTERWQRSMTHPPLPFPLVIKTDDGVGCEDTRIIMDTLDWNEYGGPDRPGDWVAQPFMDGESLSLCGLFAQGKAILLSVNRQHIHQQDNTFMLKGCSVNTIADENGIFSGLIQQIAAAIPELWGYAGVDLIRNKGGLHVLEINPRLTSSYVGLRAALGLNPAQLVIDLLESGHLPQLAERPPQPVEVTW
jgi:predicted ATP-grasp superfamily ATP-dependent carboligase